MKNKTKSKQKEEERPISEIEFRDTSDRLKEEYLDRYEGVKLEKLSTTRFDENSDLSMTIEIYVFGLCTERVIRSSWYPCFHEALLCWDTTHKIPTVTYKLNML